MKEDINFEQVEDIAVAIVKNNEVNTEFNWKVYLLNFKETPITNVLVASKGYGQHKGEKLKTSILRQYFESIPAKSFVLIEPIDEQLFKLSNEFWVSFYINKDIYDKKYVFLAESIIEDNIITIPMINEPGVMIK